MDVIAEMAELKKKIQQVDSEGQTNTLLLEIATDIKLLKYMIHEEKPW